MATLSSAQVADSFPVYTGMGGGALCVAYGLYDVAADPAPADIFRLFKLPAGARVISGALRGADIDTDATETLDLDVGWEATTDEVADPDGFGNFGPLLTDPVNAGGISVQYGGVLNTAGPKLFSAAAVIAVTVADDAATFAAGALWSYCHYTTP